MLCPGFFSQVAHDVRPWHTIPQEHKRKTRVGRNFTPSKEEPGEMEGEVYPETMSQLAPTKTISPKEHLTSRKRVCVCVC